MLPSEVFDCRSVYTCDFDYITSLTSGKAVVNSRHDKLELTEDDPDVIVIDDLPENENIDKGGIQNGKINMKNFTLSKVRLG